MSAEYTELEIYIRSGKPTEKEGSSRHDVEAKVDGMGLWRDEIILDENELSPLEDSPRDYGACLEKQLLGGRLKLAYERARGTRTGKVRLRLLLDSAPDPRHQFRWERLFIGADPVSTSPLTPFSRYLLDERATPRALDVPDDGVFHLVVAIANPANLPGSLAPVKVQDELRALARAFRDIGNRSLFRIVVMHNEAALAPDLETLLDEIQARRVRGPVTFDSVQLESQSADGLHLICHGKFDRKNNAGYLYLEDATGQVARVDDATLAKLNSGHLKLVYLQACESGMRAKPVAGEGLDPKEISMVGVAARLVESGIPAVVAMQQPVEMDDARRMTMAFYQSLVRDGYVDLAVNAGRQAIASAGGDRFSVPALYMRLRDGRLWHADPFREMLRAQVTEWEHTQDMKLPVPLRATKFDDADHRQARGSYDVTELALSQLKDDTARVIVLAGTRGSGKTAVLDRVAWRLAKDFLEKDGQLVPVRFALTDVAGHADLLRFVEIRLRAQTGAAKYGEVFTQQLQSRNIVLIVDGEEDVVPARRADFLQALQHLPSGVQLMLSVDVLALEDWRRAQGGFDHCCPTILHMERMERPSIMRYLTDLEASQGKKSEPLAAKIQRNRWWDLTGEAWMLRRIIRYQADGLNNRADLFGRVTAERIGQLGLGSVTPTCAEEAAAAIAWRLQETHAESLSGRNLYEVLDHVRREREFNRTEITSALIQPCELMRRSGEDGVRFSYEGFQAYYAARALLTAPDRERKLDGIIATLGSSRHLRLWEDTLLILAGLMDDFDQVLVRILAGSSAASGEQVYLAAKCFLEIPAKRRATPTLQELGGLLVDTLIWRSHPNNDRPIVDRKKAIKWLTEIETGLPAQDERAIENLVHLACDEVSKDWSGRQRYEFSGIRIEALNVMLARRQAVGDYVLAKRPDLIQLLHASNDLLDNQNPQPMIHLMKRGNAHESPLAVFALGLSGHDVIDTLAETSRNLDMNTEVLWAIAEMLPRLDPEQTLEKAIRPMLSLKPSSRVAYMINKVGRKQDDTDAYLMRALASGDPRVIGRALRTLADQGDESMRAPCEAIVNGDWAAVRTDGRIKLPKNDPDPDNTQSLQHAALEGLRSIGDTGSIKILQRAWLKLSPILSQLSYDVAESIYWRLTEKKN